MRKSKSAENRVMDEFLAPANFLLKLSGRAYEKYMANKIYLHALNIRKANEMIYRLILEKIHLVPEKLQYDCVELLNHYDCWMLQFKDEEQKRKPVLTDEFIFQRADGQMAYPRSSEQHIFDTYLKFTKQKNK
ncbi:MAG: hypothetical protein U0T68_00665 [Ferruginibacter sp.]|jgi:hypothetical protein